MKTKREMTSTVMQAVKASDPTKAGYRAAKGGRSEDSNPHKAGTNVHKLWNDGWLEGFTESY